MSKGDLCSLPCKYLILIHPLERGSSVLSSWREFNGVVNQIDVTRCEQGSFLILNQPINLEILGVVPNPQIEVVDLVDFVDEVV